MVRRYSFACGLLFLAAAAHAQPTLATATLQPDGGGPTSTPIASVAPTVYFIADEMPAFPGGGAAQLKFMTSRLKYPAAALDRSISGKVYVAFTVDPDGHLHDPHVVRGLGFGLDDEAVRLVRLMPWWTPGKIQGQPVWVSITLPIVFRAL